MRRVLCLVAVMFATSALADEKLPISGVFGDEAGCKRMNGYNATEPGQYLEPDWWQAFDQGCSFMSIGGGEGEPGQRVWSVIGLCALDGGNYSSDFSVQEAGRDTVVVILSPGAERIVLKRCI